jgi:hypothetical protein
MAEYIKNTAFNNYKFPMTDANSPTLGKTALTVSVEISNDAGTFSNTTGSVTALQSGWYVLNTITAGEMNNDSVALVAMATGANDFRDVIYPKIFSTTDIKSDTAAILEDTTVLNNLSATDVNSEIRAVFDAAIPGGPTADSPYERIARLDDVTPNSFAGNFADLNISASTGEVTVKSLNTPVDLTAGAMNSATNQIFTDPLSKYEGTTDRSLTWGVAKLTNAVDFSGEDLQVKRSDDSTNLFVQVSSTDANANPLVALDTT